MELLTNAYVLLGAFYFLSGTLAAHFNGRLAEVGGMEKKDPKVFVGSAMLFLGGFVSPVILLSSVVQNMEFMSENIQKVLEEFKEKPKEDGEDSSE